MNKNLSLTLLSLALWNATVPAGANVATGGSYTLDRSLTSASQQSASGGVYSLTGSVGEGFSHVTGDNQVVAYPMKRVYDGFLSPLKVEPGMTNVLSLAGGTIQMALPGGVMPKAYEAMVETSLSDKPIAVAPATVQDAGQKLVSQHGSSVNAPLSIVEVRLLMDDDTLLTQNANNAGTFSFSFTDHGDGGGFLVTRLNELTGTWDRVSGDQSAMSSNSSSQFSVMQAGVYAVFQLSPGAGGPPYAFPVPWRPNVGQQSLYGSLQQGITFANLRAAGEIQIFNTVGELVREISIPENAMQLRWDGRTGDGAEAASGVYIWSVKSGGSRQIGKLMIIR